MSRRYLLDSGPAFDYLFKRKGVDVRLTEARKKGPKVGICIPVLGEIVGGLEASSSRDASWAKARPRLEKLLCWPFDRAARMNMAGSMPNSRNAAESFNKSICRSRQSR